MRPTLEEQIAVSKMADAECIKALRGVGLERADFWLYRRLRLVWRVIHWNWFDCRK